MHRCEVVQRLDGDPRPSVFLLERAMGFEPTALGLGIRSALLLPSHPGPEERQTRRFSPPPVRLSVDQFYVILMGALARY